MDKKCVCSGRNVSLNLGKSPVFSKHKHTMSKVNKNTMSIQVLGIPAH